MIGTVPDDALLESTLCSRTSALTLSCRYIDADSDVYRKYGTFILRMMSRMVNCTFVI